MNLPIRSQHDKNSYVVDDYGSLKEIDINQEEFGDYYEKIIEEIEILKADSRSPELMKRVSDRLNYISNIVKFQESGKLDIENIESLKHLQKLTVSGYINFLIWSFFHENKTGYVVMPTGQGKTMITLLLSSLNPNNSIIITDNNIGKEQFLSEASRISDINENVDKINMNEDNSDKVIIGGWHDLFVSIENQTIDFHKYSTIFIDEADVNGLSDKRQNILNKLINEFGINIIGLSATEEQASGKKLSDFYEYDILNFPMPQSLPELFKINEIPNINFKDVFLNSELSVKTSKLEGNDNEIDNFIKNSDWIKQMLEYHLSNNEGKKFILGMRNNSLNKSILKVTSVKGLHLAELTGETPQEERKDIINKLKTGEIDGIIGCKLTGRGLDIPECEIVYNSLLTYSPQLFWQLGGRAARFDMNDFGKEKEIVTFLPQKVYKIDNTEEGEDNNKGEKNIQSNMNKARVSLPLSFQAFFNNKYFSDVEGQKIDNKSFRLSDLDKEQIKSIPDVATQLEGFNTYGSFSGRPEVLAKIILSYNFDITFPKLNYLLKIKSKEKMDDFFHENLNVFSDVDGGKDNLAGEYKSYLDKYKGKKVGSLTISKEKELFKQYFDRKDEKNKSKIQEEILEYHYNIIIALACKMQTEVIGIDDLIQAGVEYILKHFSAFKPYTRFSSFCSLYAFKGMQDCIKNTSSDIRISMYMQEIQNKIQKVISKYEQSLDIDETCSQGKMIEFISKELNITNKKVEEVLNSYHIYQDFDESEIIIHESGTQIKGYKGVPIGALANEGQLSDQTLEDTYKDDLVNNIHELLAGLTLREAKVLRMRFGIDMTSDFELEEVGIQFDTTRERIRQIEAKALRKLSHPSRAGNLKVFYDEEVAYELADKILK